MVPQSSCYMFPLGTVAFQLRRGYSRQCLWSHQMRRRAFQKHPRSGSLASLFLKEAMSSYTEPIKPGREWDTEMAYVKKMTIQLCSLLTHGRSTKINQNQINKILWRVYGAVQRTNQNWVSDTMSLSHAHCNKGLSVTHLEKSEEPLKKQSRSSSPHVVEYIGWDPVDMLYYGSHERSPPLCVDGA